MPKAILTLDDHEDGQMSLTLFLEGGFQVDSNAHQGANLILKYLQELGSVQSAGEIRELTGEEAAAVIAQAQGAQNIAMGLPEPLETTPAAGQSAQH